MRTTNRNIFFYIYARDRKKRLCPGHGKAEKNPRRDNERLRNRVGNVRIYCFLPACWRADCRVLFARRARLEGRMARGGLNAGLACIIAACVEVCQRRISHSSLCEWNTFCARRLENINTPQIKHNQPTASTIRSTPVHTVPKRLTNTNRHTLRNTNRIIGLFISNTATHKKRALRSSERPFVEIRVGKLKINVDLLLAIYGNSVGPGRKGRKRVYEFNFAVRFFFVNDDDGDDDVMIMTGKLLFRKHLYFPPHPLVFRNLITCMRRPNQSRCVSNCEY